MAASDLVIKLIAPSDESQWAVYHDIRRRVLFERRGRYGIYDPNHVDERKSGNHPLVLTNGNDFIGVVRVDLSGDLAQLRRVAIDEGWQRQGFGRHLLALVEQFAAARGAKRVESAVAPEAVRFYEKCGYRSVETADGSSSVRMAKSVVPAA
jgi:GNAT superfamily N-acetyltransferase